MQIARILLIEDDSDDVELMVALLEETPLFRLCLESFDTLAQGITYLEQEKIDVVLTDLSLPDAQGLETFRQLHRQFPQIPVVILSGLDDEAVAIAALQEGAQDYLVKGNFDGPLLMRSIRYAIERQRLLLAMEQQKRAIQGSEEQFRTIINRNADGMLVVDQNDVIQFVNPAAEALLGRQAQELVGAEFGFPLLAEESTEIDVVSRSGETITAEMRLVEITWAEKPAYLASLRDITWRKQAAAELKQLNKSLEGQVSKRTAELKQTNKQLIIEISDRQRSEELLRTVVAGAPIVLWSFSQAGILTLFEGKNLAVLGLAPDAVVGQSVFQVYRNYPKTMANHHRVLAGAEVQWREEINQVVYECRATPIVDSGLVVGGIGVATDVTERVVAEAQRDKLLAREREARAEAERANRLKDEFLAILSHELRTPLNPIVGWSGLLRTGNLNAEQTERAVETIERNAQLQAQLIDDLLDISRILRGKLKLEKYALTLQSVVEAAIETVRLAAEAKSIEIVTRYETDVGQVLGDPDRLQQVVWNLLTNAVKFTPSGGRVDVQLRRTDARVQLRVKDTGKGIDPEFLPYLFDKFRQENSSTTRSFGGLGLGLAIVRNLVELHGGTIKAQSPGKDQGATFTVEFPLLQRQISSRQSKTKGAESSLEGVRLLVVDDDSDNIDLTVFWLERYGAQVTAITEARQALEHLVTEQPDLLLSDVGMPEMDGYELIRQVRAMPPPAGAIKAIALTAYASQSDRQRILAAGFDARVIKPVKPEQLVQEIQELIEFSHQ